MAMENPISTGEERLCEEEKQATVDPDIALFEMVLVNGPLVTTTVQEEKKVK